MAILLLDIEARCVTRWQHIRESRNKQTVQRWLETKVLVIDEVSMLSADLFEKLEWLARKVRVLAFICGRCTY
jgi:thymidine kinase